MRIHELTESKQINENWLSELMPNIDATAVLTAAFGAGVVKLIIDKYKHYKARSRKVHQVLADGKPISDSNLTGPQAFAVILEAIHTNSVRTRKRTTVEYTIMDTELNKVIFNRKPQSTPVK